MLALCAIYGINESASKSTMNWIINNASVVLSAASLIVSIVAIFRTSLMASNTAILQKTMQLSEYHEKVMLGRQAMETIFRNWKITSGKNIQDCNEVDLSEFIDYYNNNYHHGTDSKKKEMSNEVHRYLSRLNHLWQDAQNHVFDIEEIMKRFGDGICMDERYTLLYLRAHQEAHPQEIFWQGVPKLIQNAKLWQSARNNKT